MSPIQKLYLGDSVYATYAYGMITLTTENGEGSSNKIHLEPEVFDGLIRFAERAYGCVITARPASPPPEDNY